MIGSLLVFMYSFEYLRLVAYQSSDCFICMCIKVYSHKVYQQQGFLSVHPESGKLVIDTSATLTVLDTFSECFLRLLDCMDNGDGAGLESILWSEMAPENAFVRSVVSLVESDGAKAPHRPERNCTCHPSWALPLCMECGPAP